MTFNNDYTDEYNLSGTTPSSLLPNASTSTAMPTYKEKGLSFSDLTPSQTPTTPPSARTEALPSSVVPVQGIPSEAMPSGYVPVQPPRPQSQQEFVNNVVSPQTQRKGFFDWFKNMPEDKKQALNMGLLSTGLNMMSAAGRSYDRPISGLALLGDAGQQGLNTYQSALTNARQEQTNALHNALLQGQIENIPLQQNLSNAQLEHLGAQTKALGEKQVELTPTRLAIMAATQEYKDGKIPQESILGRAVELTKTRNLSPISDIEKWKYGESLPPDEQKKFYSTFGKPQTTVNVGGAEGEEQKVIGKGLGELYNTYQKEAQSAQSQIDTNTNFKQLLSQTDTGKLEPYKTKIATYAEALGVPVDPKWAVNQTIEAISNKLTIMARKSGEGQILAGQISDADREFLKQSVPGLGKTKESNIALLDINNKISQRQIEVAGLADNYLQNTGSMKGFNSYLRDWVNKNPLFPLPTKTLSPEAQAYYDTLPK